MRRSLCAATALITVAILSFLGCHGMTHSGPSQLTVADIGSGVGTVTSSPAGINCPGTCSASFSPGTQVVLTATPAAKTTFDGWSGACLGTEPCTLTLNANAFVNASFTGPPPVRLSISFAGPGTGLVTSNPAGISCPKHCSGRFPTGSQVTLSAAPGTGFAFGGWSGACVGTATTCIVTMSAASTVTASFGGSLQSLNHIIFLAQENRSFDHYFGAMREYWAQNGFADQPFDGLPQFNIPAGGTPSNPGCVPNSLNCNAGGPGSGSVSSFHLLTACIENPSPSWNESHVDRNLNNPVSSKATMDGFVETAAHDARASTPPYLDVKGRRAMGFYDGTDLNYYYFMASSFATSDRWFSPVMSRTQPNRMYLVAATSQGHAYPPHGSIVDAKTIFEELQNAGLSWKIYVNPHSPGHDCSDTDSACLMQFSEIGWFKFGQQMKGNPALLANVQSINQYLQDAQNGTLPNVALIEPAYGAGLDEHPTVNDNAPTNIQAGAHYVSNLINTLMQGPSWKDSAFILTFDEGGGLYDHVPPFNGDSSVPAPPNPDGIKPNDIPPLNICTRSSGPPCDFVFTGFRVPLIVVSPFTKSHYVSHTPTDYTSILKLIETRFGLPALTNRDAWAMDMTEFFDFVNVPMATPPTPPQQSKTDACDINPP